MAAFDVHGHIPQRRGRTIRQRCNILLDASTKGYSVRNLIVGLSKTPLGQPRQEPRPCPRLEVPEQAPGSA